MPHPALFEKIVALRRDFHQYPETGFDVQRTARQVAETLSSLEVSVKEGVGQSGVVGDIQVDPQAPWIALRADMDALPMEEENDLPYCSQHPGKAHMCGHDAHTAMLLGAAHLLAESRHQLKHNVRLIFQPSEEALPGGAPGMIQEGCLEGVHHIYALHCWPELETGTIGFSRGPAMAQADRFHIRIQGKGGHAAAPHTCVDPVNSACQLVTAMNTLIGRTVDPLDSIVLSICQVHAGSSYNVIPSSAELQGTLRSYCQEKRARMVERLKDMVPRFCEAFSCEGALEFISGYPPVYNHDEACARVARIADSVESVQTVIDGAPKALFGEDFAYYGEKVPACFIQLGVRNESKGCIHPLHHPQFNLDEDALWVGAQLLHALASEEV